MKAAARPSRPRLRCAYCHDALGWAEGVGCGACGARLHPECGAELSACPTLGCSGRPSLPAAPPGRSRGWTRRAGAGAALLAGLLAGWAARPLVSRAEPPPLPGPARPLESDAPPAARPLPVLTPARSPRAQRRPDRATSPAARVFAPLEAEAAPSSASAPAGDG